MKGKPVSPKKVFYTMGEVAKLLSANPSRIRYWEREFDLIKPKKNKKGNRLFSSADVDNLKTIYHLVENRGFTLDGAKQKLKDNSLDVINEKEIISHLLKIRAFLMDLKKTID